MVARRRAQLLPELRKEGGAVSEWGDKFLTEADNARLRAENAKLRELLTDLAVCACGKYCYGCPHQYDGCDRDERLRELGMEVEE